MPLPANPISLIYIGDPTADAEVQATPRLRSIGVVGRPRHASRGAQAGAQHAEASTGTELQAGISHLGGVDTTPVEVNDTAGDSADTELLQVQVDRLRNTMDLLTQIALLQQNNDELTT